jgi:hypothetical protein
MNYDIKDITGIVLNWRTARMSRGAVVNLQKAYPELKEILIGDDGSHDGQGNYRGAYGREAYNLDERTNMDNDLLKGIPNTRYFEFEHQGHGLTIDRIVEHVTTPLMLTMDSDLRVVKPGLLEKYLEEFNKNPDKIYGIGPTLHNECVGKEGSVRIEFIDPFFTLWNMAPLKRYPRYSFTNYVGPAGNHFGTAFLLNWMLTHPDETHVENTYEPVFMGPLERLDELYHLRKFRDDNQDSERSIKWTELIDG